MIGQVSYREADSQSVRSHYNHSPLAMPLHRATVHVYAHVSGL